MEMENQDIEAVPVSPQTVEEEKGSPTRKSKGTSPSKSPKRKWNYKRLQLYNPAHKLEILKLFTGVIKPFKLVEEEGGRGSSLELDFEASDDEENEDPTVATGMDTTSKTSAGKYTCTTCAAFSVDSLMELRNHYKLDWHRYNLKLKLHGQSPVSEARFSEMMDDLSSIEGSDSEDEGVAVDIGTGTNGVSRLIDKIPTLLPSEFGKEETELPAKSREMRELSKTPKNYHENESNQVFGMYKHITEIMPKSKRKTDFAKCLDIPLNITIIMVSGGHFAASIFQGGDVILHKTFHSYTVRAKQGGSQGTKDAKSGGSHPKSAGASLRRYNEQSFQQHVQELMESWKQKISSCQAVFYRAVSSSSNVLFGGKTPAFQRNDEKLRTIPFPTNRPTFTEVKRVHSFLTAIHVYDTRSDFLADHFVLKKASENAGSPKKKNFDRAKSRSPKRRECPPAIPSSSASSDLDGDALTVNVQYDDDDDDTGALVESEEIIDFNDLREYDDSINSEMKISQSSRKPKRSKPKKLKEPFLKPGGFIGDIMDALSNGSSDLPTLTEGLRNHINSLCDDEKLQAVNQPVDPEGCSLLHLAAKFNNLSLIGPLLELGWDPAMKNKSGKVPYAFASTKEGRNEFRRFMGEYPDMYDYKIAQIPPPLTEEEEAEKAERKKLLNKQKREKEKKKKAETKEKEMERTEQDRFLKLSDREKRALAAEQRILAQAKRNSEQQPILVRCFECACDITGKIPFEYNQNTFCTPKCLAIHRKKFPTPLSVQ